jgi:hypothetical protein
MYIRADRQSDKNVSREPFLSGWQRKPDMPAILAILIKSAVVTKKGCLQTWLASRNAAAIAQLVEHLIRNEGAGGSNPSCGTRNLLFIIEKQSISRIA